MQIQERNRRPTCGALETYLGPVRTALCLLFYNPASTVIHPGAQHSMAKSGEGSSVLSDDLLFSPAPHFLLQFVSLHESTKNRLTSPGDTPPPHTLRFDWHTSTLPHALMPLRGDSILDTGSWEKNRSNLHLPAAAHDFDVPLQPPTGTSLDDFRQVHVKKGPAFWLYWFFRFLRPALFVREKGPPKTIRKTAYLDGLRGFAAFLVYLGHHQSWAHENASLGIITEHAFGFSNNYFLVCVPGLRVFFSGGHIAVCVFFVISGYVLSAKPLTLIQSGEYVKLGDNLCSALFRRWLRLYIPVFGTTFLFMTSWHAFGIWTAWPKHQQNYYDELFHWFAALKDYSFVFRGGGEPWLSYNFHAWSIPTEFKGSIVIYTVLLALSRCTRNARLGCEVGLIFYFLYIVDGWFCALFLMGLLLCDLDLLEQANRLPDIIGRFKPWKNAIFYNLFVFGVYLAGVPHVNRDINVLRISPGWHYLSFLTPQAVFDYKWFYLFWAATFLVSSINRISWLKRFFELRFNQYMGRISFAFYLVHGPVLWILGDRLYAAVGWSRAGHAEGIPEWVNIYPMSKAGPFGMEVSFVALQLIILPVTLWLSEIATKMFDEPSVKFAQWCYKQTLAP